MRPGRTSAFLITATLLLAVFSSGKLRAQPTNAAGSALMFNPSINFVTQHVVVASSPSLVLSNRLTFEAWIRPFVDKCLTIISRGDGGGASDYIFEVGYDGSGCGSRRPAPTCDSTSTARSR